MNKDQLLHLIDEAIKEDVGDGDHSTLSCIDPAAKGKAVLKIKQDGVLAGVVLPSLWMNGERAGRGVRF